MTKPTLPRRPNESYTARYRREQGEPVRAKPGGNQKRITRAVLYACVAVVFVVVWLVVELGADRDEMLDFLGASLLFVALPVALGVAAGVLIIAGKALRKWRAKRRQ